jgi:TonB family protein
MKRPACRFAALVTAALVLSFGPPVFGQDTPPVSEASQASARQTVCDPAQAPVYLRPIASTHAMPPYPALSVRLAEQGNTILKVLIAQDGSVQSDRLVASSGSDRLDQAALDFVRAHWRWEPPTVHCRPSMVSTNVRIGWHLVEIPTPDQIALATRYLTAMGIDTAVKGSTADDQKLADNMLKTIAIARQADRQVAQTILEKSIATVRANQNADMIRRYAEYFSKFPAETVTQLISLYETPLGRKVASHQPLSADEKQQFGQFLVSHGDVFQASMAPLKVGMDILAANTPGHRFEDLVQSEFCAELRTGQIADTGCPDRAAPSNADAR